MEIIDEVRRQNGIVFPSDEQVLPEKADYLPAQHHIDTMHKEEESL